MSILWTIVIVHLVAMMSPGPDLFMITQMAVSRSRTSALFAALGITVGNIVWAGLALMGLQWVFERYPWLQSGIMLAGALYLLYLGFLILRSVLAAPSQNGAGNTETTVPPLTHLQAFLRGLFTNLANAKCVIYFTSIFSMMLTPDMTTTLRWTIFVIILVEALLWFSTVALVFGMPVMRRAYLKASRYIDMAAGGLFVFFALLLVWEAVHLLA